MTCPKAVGDVTWTPAGRGPVDLPDHRREPGHQPDLQPRGCPATLVSVSGNAKTGQSITQIGNLPEAGRPAVRPDPDRHRPGVAGAERSARSSTPALGPGCAGRHPEVPPRGRASTLVVRPMT
jgi:hypothetical protein